MIRFIHRTQRKCCAGSFRTRFALLLTIFCIRNVKCRFSRGERLPSNGHFIDRPLPPQPIHIFFLPHRHTPYIDVMYTRQKNRWLSHITQYLLYTTDYWILCVLVFLLVSDARASKKYGISYAHRFYWSRRCGWPPETRAFMKVMMCDALVPPPPCSLQAYRTLVDYEIHKATPTICVLEPCSSQPPFFFFFSFLTVNNMPFIFFSPFSSGSHRYMPPYPPHFPSLFFYDMRWRIARVYTLQK